VHRVDGLVGPGAWHGRDRARQLHGSASWRAVARSVGRALGANGASLLDLVGHRIADGAHGMVRRDPVAVRVQEAVELYEGERAVAPKDGEARRPQVAARDHGGLAAHGGEDRLPRRWWAAAVGVVEAGPQAFAHIVERAHEAAPALEPFVERVVEPLQFSFGVVLDALEGASPLRISFVSSEHLETCRLGQGHGRTLRCRARAGCVGAHDQVRASCPKGVTEF
jgi:hypothetical protein